jgi:hypothetical protein
MKEDSYLKWRDLWRRRRIHSFLFLPGLEMAEIRDKIDGFAFTPYIIWWVPNRFSRVKL